MIIADAYTGIDQTTPTRTLPTPAQGTGNTPSLSVTSVADDLVIGSLANSKNPGDLTTIASSLVTIRQEVEGADIGGYEACAQGDVVATGTSTSVGFTQSVTSGSGTYVLFGAALIPSSSAATATTFTGPTSGLDDVQSTDFTVGANGPITGTVTCTFTNSLAGTWSFATRDISAGTPTQTVKYTPSVPGVHVLGVTDNGGLTDAASINYTALVRHYPNGDLVTTGWTWDGASASAALSDGSDATAATSPDITGSQGPLDFSWVTAIPAGVTHTRKFRAEWLNAAAEVRLIAMDSSNVSVGASPWVSVVDPLAEYSATFTTTAISTRGRIEVRTPARYALAFPSNLSGGDTSAPFVALQFLNPQANGLPIWGTGSGASRSGLTYIWKVRPHQQTGYFVTFWWSNNGGFSWDSSSSNTYYGCHPYPQSASNSGTTHYWEIAGGDSGNDTINTLAGGPKTVVQDVWYTQALRVIINGDGSKTLRYYLNLPSVANADIIEKTVLSTWGETNPPSPALTFGDSPWYADYQHERLSGDLDCWKIVAVDLGESDTLSEAADMTQMVTSAGIANIWHGKDGFSSPIDLTCNFGTGRTFTWADEANMATLVTRP